MTGRIFIVSGCSGSGKTTIVDWVFKNKKDIYKAISFTTRKPRPGEKDGIDYYFVDKMKFIKMIEQGEFIEFSEVYGNLYGTTADSFRKAREGYDVIKVIDVQGVEKLRNLKLKACYIFFEVPINVLKNRLEKRGEKEMPKRLAEYNHELSYKKYFDHIIDASGTEKDIPKNGEKLFEVMDNYKD